MAARRGIDLFGTTMSDGPPIVELDLGNIIDQSFDKEIDSTPGGHGGPPLQYGFQEL